MLDNQAFRWHDLLVVRGRTGEIDMQLVNRPSLEKQWQGMYRDHMVAETKVNDLCYRDVVRAGTFATHGLTEYIDYEHVMGKLTNYLDFIWESISLFFYEFHVITSYLEERTELGSDPRADVLLSCIACYARSPFAQRRMFFDKNSMVGATHNGELSFRWHSHCDYLRGELDETRRMRFLYRTLAEFILAGSMLASELPYRDLGGVVVPTSVPGVPFLQFPES